MSLEAHHSCMSHRGANVPSTTRTVALRGLQPLGVPDLRWPYSLHIPCISHKIPLLSVLLSYYIIYVHAKYD